MDFRAVAIHAFAQNHSPEEVENLIGMLLDKGAPRDDHGHYYKEAGAPCPHHKSSGERKPRNALKSKGNNGIIYRASRRASREKKKEKDISHQTNQQIRKGINSLEKHIQKHEQKISHPEYYYADWESFSGEEKEGRLRHWEHEIEVAHENIQNRKNELDRRAKKNE